MEETPASGVAETADETETRSKYTLVLSEAKIGEPTLGELLPVVGTALKEG